MIRSALSFNPFRIPTVKAAPDPRLGVVADDVRRVGESQTASGKAVGRHGKVPVHFVGDR